MYLKTVPKYNRKHDYVQYVQYISFVKNIDLSKFQYHDNTNVYSYNQVFFFERLVLNTCYTTLYKLYIYHRPLGKARLYRECLCSFQTNHLFHTHTHTHTHQWRLL